MHHVLRFYCAHQELVLRLYMFAAKFSKLPLIGKYVKILMNWYALTRHMAWILTFEEAKRIINKSTSIAVGDCKCRKVFNNCDGPIKTDLVIGIGYDVFTDIRKDEFVKISKEEARNIIDECSKKGLIQTLIKCRGEVYAICNCCMCCCVPLRLNKVYGIKSSWIRDKNAMRDFIDTFEKKTMS